MGWFDYIDDALDVVGVGIGLFSDHESAENAEDVADMQTANLQKVAEDNKEISLYDAKIAEESAVETWKQTNRNLLLHARMSDELLGKQKTSYAKAGVATSTGSAIDVMRETQKRLLEDAVLIKYNGVKSQDRQKALAKRYRLLADKGLRDAAAQSILIQEQAKYEQDAFKYQSVGRVLDFASDVFTEG